MTNGITITNAIIESIVSRSTTKYYDPAVTLSDDQIRELVRIATTAPTSFHMQNVTHTHPARQSDCDKRSDQPRPTRRRS